MGVFRRDWWRTRRHFHSSVSGVRRFFGSLLGELVSAPKKSFFDIATNLPIGLIVIPHVREMDIRARIRLARIYAANNRAHPRRCKSARFRKGRRA